LVTTEKALKNTEEVNTGEILKKNKKIPEKEQKVKDRNQDRKLQDRLRDRNQSWSPDRLEAKI